MEIFITDLNKIINRRDFISAALLKLGHDDLKRFQKIKDEMHALQFLVGRMLVFEVFGGDFETLETGKVISKKAYLSLAHSNNFVVLATDEEPVGVDIEKIDEQRDFKAVARRMKFENCENATDFCKKWTAYEADFKLGNEFENPFHRFFEYKGFIICISSLKNMQCNITLRQNLPF
ncbi:MAG: hypothetical protein IJ870_04575 [Alphaproteobacteria bacterium]|nr:hypothetical protein [Alphaproteobacteria bacterium]